MRSASQTATLHPAFMISVSGLYKIAFEELSEYAYFLDTI